MAQQLIQQKTEQLEHMRETYNYLTETHPAEASLGETIKEVEAAIENIKKEKAKTRPKAKAYSSRQEADKKVAGSRVAYIKWRQRKRAAEHRLKTRKERAIPNVARQEEAEIRFNRPKYGQKDKVFPLAEGKLAKERQAAPMHRRERAFIKDDDEEMPEIKQRKVEVPPSEKERINRKRKEENKKRRMKKEEEKLLAKLKKKEKQEKEVAEKPKGPKEPASQSRDKWGRWSQEEWDTWNAEKKCQHWKHSQLSQPLWTLATLECRLRMIQRLQETEYGRKRIQIAEKREREAKEGTEKGKKLRVSELPQVQPPDNPGGFASGSGIKRPAPDPPEDPRLEPDPSGAQLDTAMEDSASSAQSSRGTKRDADIAGVAVEPMDHETAITNLLLSHRKGFLAALHAKLQKSPEALPVCEEQFDIDPETPWYCDDAAKPLDTQMAQAARREECQVIQTMGVWEPILIPKNEKVISTRCQQR